MPGWLVGFLGGGGPRSLAGGEASFFNQLFFTHAPRGRSCAAAAVSLACPCRPICGLLRCLSHSLRCNPPHWPPPLRPRPLAARCESPPLPLPVCATAASLFLSFGCFHLPATCQNVAPLEFVRRESDCGGGGIGHGEWRVHGALRPSAPGGSRARPPFGTLAHVPFRQPPTGGGWHRGHNSRVLVDGFSGVQRSAPAAWKVTPFDGSASPDASKLSGASKRQQTAGWGRPGPFLCKYATQRPPRHNPHGWSV